MNDYVFSLGSDHEQGIGATITVRAVSREAAMEAVARLVASFNEYALRTEHGVLVLFTDASRVALAEGPEEPHGRSFEIAWSSGGHAVLDAASEEDARAEFRRQRPEADICAVRVVETAHA